LMYVGLSRVPINTDRFIAMHDAAFRYFGGCPEECVYDQTKRVVLHEQYRELTLNQAFHAYATAAGFRIQACEGCEFAPLWSQLSCSLMEPAELQFNGVTEVT